MRSKLVIGFLLILMVAGLAASRAQAQYSPNQDQQVGPDPGAQYPDQDQQPAPPPGDQYPAPGPQAGPPPGGQYPQTGPQYPAPPGGQYPQQYPPPPGGQYPQSGGQYPPPPGQYPPPGYPPQRYPYPYPPGYPPQRPYPPQQQPQQNNNEPGAARISMMRGEVSTQRGDSGDWSAAQLNGPMMAGDKISTGDRSSAEIQLDYADVFRVGDHTRAQIATLTRNDIQVQVGQGVASYTAFPNGEARVEIDTPNVAIKPIGKEGIYRISVDSESSSQVMVRKGEAEISTPSGSVRVHKGQLITVQGMGADAQYNVGDAPADDDWDRWNNDRDHIIRSATSWGKTNRYYTGSEDLDTYGTWSTVPDYGPVWVPTVAPGWVPYRAGTWVWEPYWGWTWVSYEPWGWAPYHYGRWMMWNGAWAWWPGPVVGVGVGFGYPYRPVWAPAYVSFFGFGGGGFGFGVGVGFGGFGAFGWLPIGPGDRFYPWWGGYRGRFGEVGIAGFNGYRGGWGPLRAGDRFSNVRMAMTDEHMRSAFSTVAAGRFGQGRVTATPVSREMLSGARAMTGNLPVTPTRASLSASGRAAFGSTVRGGGSEHFFGTRAAAPQSFDRQAAQVHDSIQRGSFGSGRYNSRTAMNTPRESMGSGASRYGGSAGTQSRTSPYGSSPYGSGREGTYNNGRGATTSPYGSGREGTYGGNRGTATPPSGNRGWQPFGSNPSGGRGATPEPRSTTPPATNRGQASNGYGYGRAYGGSPYGGSAYGRAYGGYGNYSRPTLNMSKPIVTPRSYGGNRPSGGGYRAPSGGHSAPSGHPSSAGHSGGHNR